MTVGGFNTISFPTTQQRWGNRKHAGVRPMKFSHEVVPIDCCAPCENICEAVTWCPRCCLRKWLHQNKKKIHWFRSCHPCARKHRRRRGSLGVASGSKQDTTHPPCDSSNTSPTLGAWFTRCLAVENPTYSIPAMQGCEGLGS